MLSIHFILYSRVISNSSVNGKVMGKNKYGHSFVVLFCSSFWKSYENVTFKYSKAVENINFKFSRETDWLLFNSLSQSVKILKPNISIKIKW